VRAYQMARKGQAVEVAPRPVHIYDIEVLGMESEPRPRVRLRITCGKGTYIRSLARDLGSALGTIAMCSRLTRTRVGGFTIEEALSSHDLMGDGGPEAAASAIQPLGRAVESLPRMDVDENQAAVFVSGNGCAGLPAGEVAVWHGDLFLGIGFGADGVVGPRKVMSAAQRVVETR
jgi:tRNA pseudouridine55 synthase